MAGLVLGGQSAAPGIAAGGVRFLAGGASLPFVPIPSEGRAAELDLARRSLAAAAAGLEALAARLQADGRQDDSEIVSTGVLMAADPELDITLQSRVIEAGLSAAAALVAATDAFAAELAALPDPVLAERADDVRSLGRRAARHALGVAAADEGGEDAVLVAESLGPADVAELGPEVVAVALSAGGVRAHAAIVARSLGLPMVVGAGPELLTAAAGSPIVVDGDAGEVTLEPGPARLDTARAAAAAARLARRLGRDERDLPAITFDGRRLRLLANASSVPELREALEQGAEGIGLLRTELHFLDAHDWPGTEIQRRFLRPLLGPLAGRPATVRLLDFGGDKTPPFLAGAEGRGIELLLAAPEALRAQLQAILAEAGGTELRVLVPMVTTAEQLVAVRSVIDRLLAADSRLCRPRLGAMVETPAAACGAAKLAAACDFFSIGTNDLTQLALGLDRLRPGEAPAHHPEVLRLIGETMRAATAAGIPVEVCGEAASDAVSLPILVGLGVDELSVGAARVGTVRRWVRGMRMTQVRALATRALKVATAAEVASLVSGPLLR